MDQPIIVTTSLILGGAGFVYLAIPNPLQKTALNGGESHKTASRLSSSGHGIPSLLDLVLHYINKSWMLSILLEYLKLYLLDDVAYSQIPIQQEKDQCPMLM